MSIRRKTQYYIDGAIGEIGEVMVWLGENAPTGVVKTADQSGFGFTVEFTSAAKETEFTLRFGDEINADEPNELRGFTSYQSGIFASTTPSASKLQLLADKLNFLDARVGK